MNSKLETFREKYEGWAGHVHVAADAAGVVKALAPILKEAAPKCVATAGLSEEIRGEIDRLCAGEGIEVIHPPFGPLPDAVDNAGVGITSASFAIAETGTLVEIVDDDAFRLVSTLPGVHVGLVRSADIVETLNEAAPRVREAFDNHKRNLAVTFISGPSRTADIELKLTLGVHGPEVAHAIIIEN